MPEQTTKHWSERLLPARRGQVLYMKTPVGPERMLVRRALPVLALFASDRAGLRGRIDGHMSFADIV